MSLVNVHKMEPLELIHMHVEFCFTRINYSLYLGNLALISFSVSR
jgi:hypothetical protein